MAHVLEQEAAPVKATPRRSSSVLRTLFRLAARAPQLTAPVLQGRLCTAIANHFGALACSLHIDASSEPAASAEPIRAVKRMKPADQARRTALEASLVRAAFERGEMLSALDLEDREAVEAFLQRTLGVIDLFAFPLRVQGRVFAVLVLYLSLVSDPLTESDLHGLAHAGEVLVLAGEG